MVWTSRCVLVLARDLHLHGPYGWDCIGFLRADLHGLYEQVCMVCPAFIVFTTCIGLHDLHGLHDLLGLDEQTARY